MGMLYIGGKHEYSMLTRRFRNERATLAQLPKCCAGPVQGATGAVRANPLPVRAAGSGSGHPGNAMIQ